MTPATLAELKGTKADKTFIDTAKVFSIKAIATRFGAALLIKSEGGTEEWVADCHENREILGIA